MEWLDILMFMLSWMNITRTHDQAENKIYAYQSPTGFDLRKFILMGNLKTLKLQYAKNFSMCEYRVLSCLGYF